MTHGAVRFAVYAGLGIVIGVIVAAAEWLTVDIFLHSLIDAPRWLQVLLGAIGFAVVPGLLRLRQDLTPSTSDAYIESFHTGRGAELNKLGPKLAGNVASIGTGTAFGLEGSAILTGATLGQVVGDRLPRVMGQRNRLVLVVAGAAAGVSALFKAPATGVLFALESPYRRDLSRHGLIPALVAAAAAYLTFVAFRGSEPLLRFAAFEIGFSDGIIAAVILGLMGGAVARYIARLFSWAKNSYAHYGFRQRFAVAATLNAAALLLAIELVHLPATLGPGEEMIVEIVRDSEIALGAIVVLFFLRLVATSAGLSVGMVGGVFIPLVVQGLLLGRVVEIMVDAPSTGLYPVIGLSAVLGAAYRTPLAAVMFVAESTGRAEFVIPALIATAISQSLMGEDSVSTGQRGERQGQLERRLDEPCSVVMIPDVGCIDPETDLLGIIDQYGARPVSLAVPVGGPTYEGLLVLHDLAAKMLEFGPEATAREAMRDLPALRMVDPAIMAARLMSEHDTAAIAVLDDDDHPVGVVTAMSLAGLDTVV